jgi:hypothetical protein
MMKRIAAMLLLGAPAVALSQQPVSYTYVEGTLISSELNDVGPLDASGDGIGIAGSFALGESFHVFGSFADEGFDFDLDRTTLQIGAGYAYALQEGFDLVGRLSYIESDIEQPGPNINDNGFGIEGAIRGHFTDRSEFDAGIRYIDVRRSDTSLFFNGRYYLRPSLALGGGLTSNDGDLVLTAAIRFSFDRD